MEIPLGNTHRIVTDRYQYKLQRFKPATAKCEEEWESMSYYTSLSAAVTAYAEGRLRASDAVGVVEALAEVKRIGAELAAALEPEYKVTRTA